MAGTMSLKDKFEEIKMKIAGLGRKKLAMIGIGILILAIVGVILLNPQGEIAKGNVKAILTFKDNKGNLLPNMKVSYLKDNQWKSGNTDTLGKLILNVPAESELKLKADEFILNGKNYGKFEKTLYIGSEDFSEYVTLSEKGASGKTTVSLILQGTTGLLEGEDFTLSFSCSNTTDTWQESGKGPAITTQVPLNCGKLNVNILSDKYENATVIMLEGEKDKLINLVEKPTPNGTLVVNVVDETGGILTGTNFGISIYGDNGVELEDYTLEYGFVTFNLAPGTYNVAIKDPKKDYGSNNVSGIVVYSKKTETVDIPTSKEKKATIKVYAVDKDNKQVIKGAKVILKDSKNKNVDEENTTETGKVVEFAVYDVKDYKIYAKKEGGLEEGYYSNNVDINATEFGDLKEITKTVELEKITASNSGKVKVTVKDEDGIPVKNAQVRFMVKGFIEDGSEDYLMEMPIASIKQFTNANGEVEYILGGSEATEKEIYPYVTKPPAYFKDRALAKKILITEDNLFDVTMIIGDATIELEAKDKETKQLISGIKYEMYSYDGKLIVSENEMPEGKTTLTVKADKRVYFLFKHPQYMPLQSRVLNLVQGQTFNVLALMSPPYAGENPKIELEGIYEKGGAFANSLLYGKEYEFRFKLTSPEKPLYQLGMHFRTGDSFILQNDGIQINGGEDSINAGNMPSITRGETYQEGAVEEIPTEGKSKWVNIVWTNPNYQEYSIGIVVKVTKPSAFIPVFWRTWAIASENQLYLRDPLDDVLGTAETNAGKKALYANTYTAELYEGNPLQCGEKEDGLKSDQFCWGNEKLYGKDPLTKQDLYYEYASNYPLVILSDYDFSFSIQNASTIKYQQYKMIIKSTKDVLKVKSYELTNADSKVETVDALTDNYNIELENLGDFSYKKNIAIKMKLQAIEKGSANIEIYLMGDNAPIEGMYPYTVNFSVLSEKNLKIILKEPTGESLPAYSDQQLILEIRDEKGDFVINNAIVIVDRKHPDYETPYHINTVLSGDSDKGWDDGIAKVNIPSTAPKSIIKVKAVKEDYAPAYLDIAVSDQIMKFDPSPFSFKLNVVNKAAHENFQSFNVINQTGSDFSITSLKYDKIGGDYNDYIGLLNIEAMQNYLNNEAIGGQALPVKIKGNEAKQSKAKAILSDEAENILYNLQKANVNIESGKLIIKLENNDAFLSAPYLQEVPIDPISINYGDVPTEDCVRLTALGGADVKNWVAGTLNDDAILEFELQNTCGVDLEGIRFQLLTNGESMPGDAAINIESGLITDPLIMNFKQDFMFPFSSVQETGKTYLGKLIYKPKEGTEGLTANFTVNVWGLVKAASPSGEIGLLEVISNPTAIEAHVTNINLFSCLDYYKASGSSGDRKIELTEGGMPSDSSYKDSFMVTNDCKVPIEIILCKGDTKCNGNLKEGGGLDLSKAANSKFTINSEADGAVVEVSRLDYNPNAGDQETAVGLYGITIWAKPKNLVTEFVNLGSMEVEIKPGQSDWFFLDNYESDIFAVGEGTASSDIFLLKNTQFVQQPFGVEANECTWEDWTTEYLEWYDTEGAEGTIMAASVITAVVAGTATVVLAAAVATATTAASVSALGGPYGIAIGAAIVVTALTVALLCAWVFCSCDSGDYSTKENFKDYKIKLGNEPGEFNPCSPSSAECIKDCDTGNDFADCYVDCKGKYKTCVEEAADQKTPHRDLAYSDSDFLNCNLILGNGLDSISTTCDQSFADIESKISDDKAQMIMDPAGSSITGSIENPVWEQLWAMPIKGSDIDSLKNETAYGLLQVSSEWEDNYGETVRCEENTFDVYRVGTSDAEGQCEIKGEGTTTKAMHLKFNGVKPKAGPLPKLNVDQCEGGGVTGEGAVPKVRFNWGWSDDIDTGQGVPIDYCEANKDEGKEIYCDATQFSIMLSKRLFKLDEFLKANTDISCPENWQQKAIIEGCEKVNEENGLGIINAGSIGIKSVKLSSTAYPYLKVDVNIENKSNTDYTDSVTYEGTTGQGAILLIVIGTSSGDDSKSIYVPTGIINKKSSVEVSHTFEVSSWGSYFATASIMEPGAIATDKDNALKGCVYVNPITPQGCWLPYTTAPLNNKMTLEYFIDKDIPSVGQYINGGNPEGFTINWPSGWKEEEENLDYLRSLMIFDAYLMRDGYTPDFYSDFVDYYQKNAFFQAGDSFNFISPYLLKTPEKFEVLREGWYNEGQRIVGMPGKYSVKVNAMFDNGKWAFKTGDELNAKIITYLHKLQGPGFDPGMALYYLPFDAKIGKDTAQGRYNYGTEFELDNDIDFYINSVVVSSEPIKLEPISTESQPISNLKLNKETDFKRINQMPDRGLLLEINPLDDAYKDWYLTFFPSGYATTVLKMGINEQSTDPFTVHYQLYQGAENLMDTGASLTSWYGLGQCLDFTGEPIGEVFNRTADKKVDVTNSHYGIEWEKGNNLGNIYLGSVLFVPEGESGYSLKAIEPDALKFYDAQRQEQTSVALTAMNEEEINYLNVLFQKIREKKVCIRNTSDSGLQLYWNVQKIFETIDPLTTIKQDLDDPNFGDLKCIGSSS